MSDRRTKYDEDFKKNAVQLSYASSRSVREGDGGYGPERVSKKLRERGEKIGYKKCAKYMVDLGLESSHNKHGQKSLTNSKKARGEGYPNILRNCWFPIVPRMGVSSDITYIKTAQGFMYHCVIRDIVTNELTERRL